MSSGGKYIPPNLRGSAGASAGAGASSRSGGASSAGASSAGVHTAQGAFPTPSSSNVITSPYGAAGPASSAAPASSASVPGAASVGAGGVSQGGAGNVSDAALAGGPQRRTAAQVLAGLSATGSRRAFKASYPLRVVEIDSLVLMKVLKHCKENYPTPVNGQLLGIDSKDKLEVTNCFPLPQKKVGTSTARSLLILGSSCCLDSLSRRT